MEVEVLKVIETKGSFKAGCFVTELEAFQFDLKTELSLVDVTILDINNASARVLQLVALTAIHNQFMNRN